MEQSRRLVLALFGAAPLMLVGTASAQPAACFDASALPLSQKSRRRSLSYVEPSPDPARRCGACSFFKAGSDAHCGACAMLSGGPVSANAVCSAFAAKAGR